MRIFLIFTLWSQIFLNFTNYWAIVDDGREILPSSTITAIASYHFLDSRTIALAENCPNPKANPNHDPNPNPNRGAIFLGGGEQLSGYPFSKSHTCLIYLFHFSNWFKYMVTLKEVFNCYCLQAFVPIAQLFNVFWITPSSLKALVQGH